MQAEQLLIILLLGGLLGMTGQGIRAIAGIKKLKDWLHLPANARHRSRSLSSIILGPRWRFR